MDTVYDVDNKQEAMDKAIADLEVRPLPIAKDDVTFTLVTEIDYESGLKKEHKMESRGSACLYLGDSFPYSFEEE
tara:strand:+ start:7976 stop:8200 length:225 start_codon:yes stop_codon:yes gene_type:complete